MTRLALIGDVHLADSPPSIRTETYRDDILAKLRFITSDAAERGCDLVIGLGDMFHIKAPHRTSHRLVTLAAEALTTQRADGASLPVFLVDGNHDVQNARSDLDSLAGQPLGVLTQIKPISLLRGPQVTGDAMLFGIPWVEPLTKDDHAVLEEPMIDLEEAVEHAYRAGLNRLVIATHASIFPDHLTPPYEHIHASDYAALLPESAHEMDTTVCYGHIHDPHGTYEAGGVRFVNNGAISRGSLHTETLKRKPVYTILETQTGETEVIEIPHKPAHEVFMLTKHELVKGKVEEVLTDVAADVAEEFLTTVASGTSGMGRFSVEHLLHSAKEKVSKAAVELIEEIIT